jgi:hypothetical protein
VTNPEVQAPAPVAASPTGDDGPADRVAGDRVEQGNGGPGDGGLGDGGSGDGSGPTPRGSVAESLADIRADRIVADARREAQSIVDAARVDARREARAIVEGARGEAETIITEAFEQRARIVRRDWAIGDGDSPWTDSGGTNDDGADDGRVAERDSQGAGDGAGTSAARADDEPVTPPLGVELPNPLTDLAPAAALAVPIESPRPSDGVAADLAPEPQRPEPERLVPDEVRRPAPPVDPAAALADLVDSPLLRARDRMGRLPALPEPAHGPRPPLPSRLRRAHPQPPAARPRRPPPPPPPAPEPPPPPARTPSRPRPRVERELPAGMRIPPDVPDWDDEYAEYAEGD